MTFLRTLVKELHFSPTTSYSAEITSDLDERMRQHGLDKFSSREKGMEFHPKTYSVSISRESSPRTFHYHVKGVSLAEEQPSKYLNVDLQTNLSFKTHISRVTKKTNHMLGFLRHNLRRPSEKPRQRPTSPCLLELLLYCLEAIPVGSEMQN